MATPARTFEEHFRDPNNDQFGGDYTGVCAAFRSEGGPATAQELCNEVVSANDDIPDAFAILTEGGAKNEGEVVLVTGVR